MTLDSSLSPLSGYTPANYRHQNASDVFGGPYPIATPSGVVHSTQPQIAPPLPPRPNSSQFYQPSQMFSPYSNNYGFNSFGGGMFGGGMGYNSFNSFGYGGYGRPGFGGNPLDPDMRFIQMAEESSRSAFQSIEAIVSTIGNIATMLDSTYFALTSSFRAILGLAANFSQLRGFFSRFFSTFAIFRTIMWVYKKLLYMIGVSKTNPSAQINLNEAFKDAEKVNSNDFFNAAASQQNSSGLAMVLFLTFIFTAPYLIMKLFGSLMSSTADQTKNPAMWMNPIDAVVLYSFNGENPSELTIKAGQNIKIAPKEVQQMNRLLSTNWLLATTDGQNVGLIPVNYIKRLETNSIPYITQSESNQNPDSCEPQVDNTPISEPKIAEINEPEVLTSVRDEH